MATGRGDETDTVQAGWRDTYEQLSSLDASELTPGQLDLLADALFWLDRPDESAAMRRHAYQAHVADGAIGRATLAAWRLFYDHFLVGEVAVANGWLERARHHVAGAEDTVEAGWLGVAETDCALAAGQPDDALAHADRALATGRASTDPALTAMALQAKGRTLVELGRVAEGLAHLDEAMVSVVNDELDPIFTGWIFCNVISTCHTLADLPRAAEWSDAAMRWCSTLREGLMYPGLCRVYSVELACLRGAWATAETDARRACEELTAHDPRYAGEAFYLVGELARRRGDLEGAQEAFTRAHELGRVPQPGLALVRLAQGRAADGAKTLRSTPLPGTSTPLPLAQFLMARVEAELRIGEEAAAREAADELAGLAGSSPRPLLAALAAAADGAVLLAEGDEPGASSRLREAWHAFRDIGLPYEAAQAQVGVGMAARQQGDDDTATLEFAAALGTFEELGAAPEVERARGLLERMTPAATPLSERELEVLRLVAEGHTNREIAEALVVSRHTVARHLSNIFTKIGVTTRSAATAYAYERELV